MTTQKLVNFDPKALASAAAKANSSGLPPVHLWTPPYCGEIDIRIAADGTWFHEGGEIKRPEMVRLFSSILRKEDARYYLVTPVEKVGIRVEDVPFVAVDVSSEGVDHTQILSFETHVGDRVTADADHPIRIVQDPKTDTPRPYVMVRAGLEARLDRKTFYRLVDLGSQKDDWFGVFSGGTFFPLIPADQL